MKAAFARGVAPDGFMFGMFVLFAVPFTADLLTLHRCMGYVTYRSWKLTTSLLVLPPQIQLRSRPPHALEIYLLRLSTPQGFIMGTYKSRSLPETDG